MKLIFEYLIVASLLFSNCSGNKKVSETLSDKLRDDSIATIQDSTEQFRARKVSDSLAKIERIRIEREIEVLKKSFTVTKDEFSGIEYFQHINFGGNWPSRKTIYMRCASNGAYCLVSNFYGDDWLFHEQVKVKFEDGTILETENVSTLDKGNRQQNEGGEVWENVIYDSGDGILERIAMNPKQKVIVRFIGRQYYDEVTLNSTDKTMIAQSYKLAQLFMALKAGS